MNDFNLRPLLEPGGRGDQIPLFGVYIGGSAAGLGVVPWTSANEDLRDGELSRGGRVYRLKPDGSEEEIPLAICIERAITGTGWVRSEQPRIAARIENGMLARVFVRGASLDALGVRTEEDIVKRLGQYEGRERLHWMVLYHYPSRAFAIAWHEREERLEHVCLGEEPREKPDSAKEQAPPTISVAASANPAADFDLRPLLRPGARGDAIALFGVHVGGSAAALRSVPWKEAEPPFGREPVRRQGGRTFLLFPSGREKEVPLAVGIERAITGDGTLRLEQPRVAACIENGVLVRVFVRGAPLEALGVRTEQDVVARFGQYEGCECRYGMTTYHYPSRAFSIGWRAEDRRLDYVCLGNTGWHEPELTARDLLDDLMRDWDDFERNAWQRPPESRSVGYYAFLRVASLASAFEVGTVQDLVTGAFIARRQPEHHRPMMEAFLQRYGMPHRARFPVLDDARTVQFTYANLLSYRRRAQMLLMHNAGWLEASGHFAAVIRATEEVNRELASRLAVMEDWLARIIDPAQRMFLRRDLVARYGYPDVDLQQLRIDEQWG